MASIVSGQALVIAREPVEQVLPEVPEVPWETAEATVPEATGKVVVLRRVAEVEVPDITLFLTGVAEVLVGLAVVVVVVALVVAPEALEVAAVFGEERGALL